MGPACLRYTLRTNSRVVTVSQIINVIIKNSNDLFLAHTIIGLVMRRFSTARVRAIVQSNCAANPFSE